MTSDFYFFNFYKMTSQQTLAKTLRQKLNYYTAKTLKEIEEFKDDIDEFNYLSTKVEFEIKITERTTGKGFIYLNSLLLYFGDLWQINMPENSNKIPITKINTYLNLFEIYQSVFYVPEILEDENLAEYWWKNHFLIILEEIANNINISLPSCLYKMRYSFKTVISQKQHKKASNFFNDLKEALKHKYVLKSIKYILIFIDIYKYVFDKSEWIIVSKESDVAKTQKELDDKINKIKLNNLNENKINKNEEEIEVEEIEINEIDF